MKDFWSLLGSILLGMVLYIIEVGIFMLLWNWVIVETFAAPEMNYWGAWGFMWLFNVIGKAFRSDVMTVTANTKKKD